MRGEVLTVFASSTTTENIRVVPQYMLLSSLIYHTTIKRDRCSYEWLQRWMEMVQHNGLCCYARRGAKDINICARDPEWHTILDKAVMGDQLECCEVICERCPAIMDHQNRADQRTSLQHATWRGR